MSRLLALVLIATLGAAAEDPLLEIASDHASETTAARQAFDAALAKANQRALRALEAAAATAQRDGDATGLARTWTEALRLDHDHAAARAFFTAAGNLDKILEAVAAGRPIPQPGALPTRLPANAQRMVIGATVETMADLGAQKAGTIVVLQYVEGQWKLAFGTGANVPASPDAVGTRSQLRLTIVEGGDTPPKVLAVVPTDTKTKAFAYQLTSDVRSLGLSIQPGPGRRQLRNSGEVVYQVGLVPARR